MGKREGKIKENNILRTELDNERSSFIPHWRDLGDLFLPRRIRLTLSDMNKGGGRNQKIIDSTGTLAARTLRSGMMAGITSPARPWFRLTSPEDDSIEPGAVKSWLDVVTKKLLTIFLKSNLYNILPITYGDLGVFGIGCVFMEEDFEEVVRFYSVPLGSYWIANDSKLRVRVFIRELSMTVRQVVEKFGKVGDDGNPDWSNISGHVRNLWEGEQRETWIYVCHVIKPNDNYDSDKLESKFKKYSSIYWEKGSSGAANSSYYSELDLDKVLNEKGYNHFPVLAPRWETTGEDSYATSCPGMIALGDVKALQTMQKRKAQAIEKMVNPPTSGPSSLRNGKPSILPGDITYLDAREGQQGFKPVHEVDPRIGEILIDIQDHQSRIQKAFFENLFLMLAQSDRREITAREVDERHEEKLLGLGPVLENVNQGLLDPLVENTFNFAFEQGMFPPPPEELQGINLKVEYISIMAQAQKLAGIASLERFITFAVNLAKETDNPTLLDKINLDQIIDIYGDRMGIDSGVIITDEDVRFIRENRAAKQQAAEALELINQGADTAQKLSNADLEKDSVMKRLVEANK